MNRIKFHNLKPAERQARLRHMIAAGINHDGQSHREFAENNKTFQDHCGLAGIEPTKRQAAKYRRKQGQAYQAKMSMN